MNSLWLSGFGYRNSQPRTRCSNPTACFGGFLNHLLSAQKD